MSFHFSHSHFNATVGHVITLQWSLRNHFHSYTCVSHCILECFRARCDYRISKPRSLTKPTRSEMEYAVDNMSLPFGRACCLGKSELETCLRSPVSEKNEIENYDRSRPFSFLSQDRDQRRSYCWSLSISLLDSGVKLKMLLFPR